MVWVGAALPILVVCALSTPVPTGVWLPMPLGKNQEHSLTLNSPIRLWLNGLSSSESLTWETGLNALLKTLSDMAFTGQANPCLRRSCSWPSEGAWLLLQKEVTG